METGQNQKIRSELQYSNRIFRNVAYFANIPTKIRLSSINWRRKERIR